MTYDPTSPWIDETGKQLGAARERIAKLEQTLRVIANASWPRDGYWPGDLHTIHEAATDALEAKWKRPTPH